MKIQMTLGEIIRGRVMVGVDWDICRPSEIQEFPSTQTFLNKKRFYLTSFNRNAEEQFAFESWTEWSHKQHLKIIREFDMDPSAFIEIPPCPDDYDKAEWLCVQAAKQGVDINEVFNV